MSNNLFETKKTFVGGLIKTSRTRATIYFKEWGGGIAITTVDGDGLTPRHQLFRAEDLRELAGVLNELADYLESEK